MEGTAGLRTPTRRRQKQAVRECDISREAPADSLPSLVSGMKGRYVIRFDVKHFSAFPLLPPPPAATATAWHRVWCSPSLSPLTVDEDLGAAADLGQRNFGWNVNVVVRDVELLARRQAVRRQRRLGGSATAARTRFGAPRVGGATAANAPRARRTRRR